jgi:hypothetical protein
LGLEAVQGPVGSRLGILVPLVCINRESSLWLGWLESYNFGGIPLTPSGMAGRELSPSHVLGHTHRPL